VQEEKLMTHKASGTRTRSMFVAILAVVMVALLAVSALAITKTTRATGGNRWKPKHIYITKNDRVRWRNPTSRTHDVTSMGGWSYSTVLSPGEAARRRFRRTGTFRFRCARHSGIVDGQCRGMCGVIHVRRG
jgi:plastocyanin